MADDGFVSDAIEVGMDGGRAKRVHRTAAKKRMRMGNHIYSAVHGCDEL